MTDYQSLSKQMDAHITELTGLIELVSAGLWEKEEAIEAVQNSRLFLDDLHGRPRLVER